MDYKQTLNLPFSGSGTVSVFDATTLDPLGAPIPVGDNPGRMAILEALDTVFVVVRGGSKIAVIEGLGPAKLVSAMAKAGMTPPPRKK